MTSQRDLWTTLVQVFVIASFNASFGLRYTVGNSVWSIPPSPDFYTNWSSSHVFYIGDSLVFYFESEFFNVVQVPKLDYESCTTSNPMKIIIISPAIITLKEEGVLYYICNISNYCQLGQKIAIIVQRHSTRFAPTPSPLHSPLLPIAPSYGPLLAPQPSQSGLNDISQSPVPDVAKVPSQDSNNGNVNGATSRIRPSFFCVSCGAFILHWACTLLLLLLL